MTWASRDLLRRDLLRRDLLRRDLLGTARPWRAAAWLLAGVPIGAALLVVGCVLVVLGVVTLPVGVGVPILIGAGLLGLPTGALERRRLRWLGGAVENPHREPDRAGLPAWLGCRFREAATWRELAYAVALGLLWPVDLLVLVYAVGTPLSLLGAPLLQARYGGVRILKTVLLDSPAQAWAVTPVGLLALAAAGYVVTGYAAARAVPVRALLGRRDSGVRELVRSRARLVDAFDAERRRIERDLHDGTQQRLVALGMTLGLARVADPTELPDLVARAADQAGQARAELHELLQGIHPRILTDRGLPAALAELGDRSPVPAEVHIDLPARLPARVEACAYFVVAEALTNVAKHSGAALVTVTGRVDGDRLVVDVVDDGDGGADPVRGTGLHGLADRVGAVDGRLVLDSPAGGPTRLRLEVPCG